MAEVTNANTTQKIMITTLYRKAVSGAPQLSDCAAIVYNEHGRQLGEAYFDTPIAKAMAIETSADYSRGIPAMAILPQSECKRLGIKLDAMIVIE